MSVKRLLILVAVLVSGSGAWAEVIGSGNDYIGTNELTWDSASGTALSIVSESKTYMAGDYAIDVKYTLVGSNSADHSNAFVGYNGNFAWVTSGNGVVIDGGDHLTLTAEVVALRYQGASVPLSNVQSANFISHM